jgi:hypothetical protein
MRRAGSNTDAVLSRSLSVKVGAYLHVCPNLLRLAVAGTATLSDLLAAAQPLAKTGSTRPKCPTTLPFNARRPGVCI